MQVKKSSPSDTEVTLKIEAEPEELNLIKERVLKRLAKRVNIPGFRGGKAPLNLVEKQLEPMSLQTEFLDEALNQLYSDAVRYEEIRPVAQPKVDIKKFVPFDTLEIEVNIEVLGPIKLGDYKSIKMKRPDVSVTDKDVDEVIESLRVRLAERKDVERAAGDGDQVWIDFSGSDDKGQPVQGADGKDYPLILGSNTFITGFEPELLGMKAGDEKTFTLTFPKDYNVSALQNRKVTFKVTVNRVQEVIQPAIDDDFAAKAGPFKDLSHLRQDIKAQLLSEREHERDRQSESEIIDQLVDKSRVDLPPSLIEEQVQRTLEDERRRLTYRGLTWQEHLDEEGMTEEEHTTQKVRPQAERRLKTGLVLSEVAEQEKLKVTEDELNVRLELYKQQYKNDPAMQAELAKPENRQDIAARILTEKTIGKLVEYASDKPKKPSTKK